MTSVLSGEDGWSYFCAAIDCFESSILGWTFTLHSRRWTCRRPWSGPGLRPSPTDPTIRERHNRRTER